jgi:hypothetical protein
MSRFVMDLETNRTLVAVLSRRKWDEPFACQGADLWIERCIIVT